MKRTQAEVTWRREYAFALRLMVGEVAAWVLFVAILFAFALGSDAAKSITFGLSCGALIWGLSSAWNRASHARNSLIANDMAVPEVEESVPTPLVVGVVAAVASILVAIISYG